jgi:hypothetical protein
MSEPFLALVAHLTRTSSVHPHGKTAGKCRHIIRKETLCILI